MPLSSPIKKINKYALPPIKKGGSKTTIIQSISPNIIEISSPDAISKNTFVRIDNNRIYTYNYGINGIVINDVEQDGIAKIQLDGYIDFETTLGNIGDVIYNLNGTLTKKPITISTGMIQEIGILLSPTRLKLNFKEPDFYV